MPAGGRFGHQGLGGPFHLQPSHLHHGNQHHGGGGGGVGGGGPASAGLPPPSFNSHGGFPQQGSQHGSMNSFGGASGFGLAGGFGGAGLGGGTGLGSSAAVMGFQHGAALQQQQAASQGMRGRGGVGKNQAKSRIREVWANNLAQEMQNLRELVERYPYVSMDTEFPGVVIRPMGAFTSRADYHYQTMRANIDLLSIIQLGITLHTEDGDTPPAHAENGPYQNGSPPCPHTWQFNFKFNVDTDMYNEESLGFLTRESGINLDMHGMQGIEPSDFGAALITSGLVMMEDVKWLSFHSGYDFGYLIKLMVCKALPDDEGNYRRLLHLFFPTIYDVKYMVKMAQRFGSVNGETPLSAAAQNIFVSLGAKSGLADLADELGVKRQGTAHTAGSDSHLTGRVFWEVKRIIFNGSVDDEHYANKIWGLNGSGALPPSLAAAATAMSDMAADSTANGSSMYMHNGTPSTPHTQHSGLAHTPVQQSQGSGGGGGGGGGGGMGSLTPGGGGGVFGRFGGFK